MGVVKIVGRVELTNEIV